jgi:hypothetical protein
MADTPFDLCDTSPALSTACADLARRRAGYPAARPRRRLSRDTRRQERLLLIRANSASAWSRPERNRPSAPRPAGLAYPWPGPASRPRGAARPCARSAGHCRRPGRHRGLPPRLRRPRRSGWSGIGRGVGFAYMTAPTGQRGPDQSTPNSLVVPGAHVPFPTAQAPRRKLLPLSTSAGAARARPNRSIFLKFSPPAFRWLLY